MAKGPPKLDTEDIRHKGTYMAGRKRMCEDTQYMDPRYHYVPDGMKRGKSSGLEGPGDAHLPPSIP